MPDHEENEREQFLINIFLKGINNRNAAKATELMKPMSLEEAYNYIKKEDKKPSGNYLRAITNTVDDSKIQEINSLKMRILELENRLKKIETRYEHGRTTYPQKSKVPERFADVSCYNCKGRDHVVRNCPKPLICNTCNRKGHIARFCRIGKYTAQKTENLRRFNELEANYPYEIEYDSRSEASSLNTNISNDEKKENNLFKIQTKTVNKKPRQVRLKEPNYPDHIIKWAEYINGTRKKQPQINKARTMISETRSEPAANKPIVKGFVENQKENIFIDSGAESSIIDFSLFQSIRAKQGLKLYKSDRSLNCANGSAMKVIGYTFLNIRIGDNSHKIKMIVVDKLFPKVILGIREMKKMNISVVPKNDCITVDKQMILFISKVRETEN